MPSHADLLRCRFYLVWLRVLHIPRAGNSHMLEDGHPEIPDAQWCNNSNYTDRKRTDSPLKPIKMEATTTADRKRAGRSLEPHNNYAIHILISRLIVSVVEDYSTALFWSTVEGHKISWCKVLDHTDMKQWGIKTNSQQKETAERTDAGALRNSQLCFHHSVI